MADIFDQIHAERTKKPTHEAGEVTAWDSATGLPIVKRKQVSNSQPAEPKESSAEPSRPEKEAPAYDVGPFTGKPIPGMQQAGNIDVNHRPSILNDDGSHSSIYSMTIGVGKDGKPWDPDDFDNAPAYALVPSIANGKFLTPNGKIPAEGDKDANAALEQKATEYYDKTRQHLGIFSSADAADKYANQTHAYSNDGTGKRVFAPSYSGDTSLPAGAADALPGIPPSPIPAGLQGGMQP